MGQNKTTRYFKYAVGEIILVVIGILIALQVSNWNTQREFDQRMHQYYYKIHEELKVTLDQTLSQIELQTSLTIRLNTILDIINEKIHRVFQNLKRT